jgi:hypothetical protein
MYTYAAKFWDLSIVQGPFPVAPRQTLNVTIRDSCAAVTHLLVAAPVGDGVMQVVAPGGDDGGFGGHGARLLLVQLARPRVVAARVGSVVRLPHLLHHRPLPPHLATHLHAKRRQQLPVWVQAEVMELKAVTMS